MFINISLQNLPFLPNILLDFIHKRHQFLSEKKVYSPYLLQCLIAYKSSCKVTYDMDENDVNFQYNR